jgi:hypothetical protein
MVHTNPEFENFKFDSREFHQYLGSLKHVINIIIGFRDMGCYSGHMTGGDKGCHGGSRSTRSSARARG